MTVIIAQNVSEQATLALGLDKLEKSEEIFSKSPDNSGNHALILLDVPGLSGYPWSVQKDTVLVFSQWLKKQGVKSISLFPFLSPGYRFRTVLSDLGLLSIIEQEHIHLISPVSNVPREKGERNSGISENYVFSPFSHVFVLSQIGLIDESNPWTCLTSIFNFLHQWKLFTTRLSDIKKGKAEQKGALKGLLESKNIPHLEKNADIEELEEIQAFKWIWNWANRIISNNNSLFPASFEDVPFAEDISSYFINLAFKCCLKSSPFYDSQVKPFNPGFILISKSLPEIETLTYQYLNVEPSNTQLSALIDDFLAKNENIQINQAGEPNNAAFIPPKPYEIYLGSRIPIEVCEGEISNDLRWYSFLLKNKIQSLLSEDFQSVKKIAILVGKNPPEPKNAEWIIIAGDEAIETTLHASFAYLNKNDLPKEPFMVMEIEIGGKSVLSNDEVDREILKKQRKLRTKIEKLEQKLSLFQESLAEKELDEERNLLILEAKRKTALKIQKIRTKIEKIQYQVPMKNEIRKIKRQKPNLIPNPKIIRIPTEGMFGLDFLKFLQMVWSKKEAPALDYTITQLELYYQFPSVERKWQKNLLLEMKNALKSTVQEITDPLIPQINQKLKEINSQYQKQINELKKRESIALRKIENDFQPQIKTAKITLDKLKKERRKQLKLKMKQKLKNIFLPKAKKEHGLDNTEESVPKLNEVPEDE